MSLALAVVALIVCLMLVPLCFVQLLYLEAMRLRTREAEALEFFKESLEKRIGLTLEEGAMAFSLMKHAMLMFVGILLFGAIYQSGIDISVSGVPPVWSALVEAQVIGSVLMLLVAHLLPQLMYRRTSGRWLLLTVPGLRLFALMVKPLLALLNFMKLLADIGSNTEDGDDAPHAAGDLEALIIAGTEEGLIEEQDRRLIQSAAEFSSKTVREVMTPRPNIVAIDGSVTLEELRSLVVREQFSRIPLFDGSIDNVIGFVHVRDMFEVGEAERANRDARSLARPVDFVPETKRVDDLLRTMQEKGAHMAVVVDEYGTTAGLVTMEDLVEELVGEIRDEHEPGHDIVRESDGSVVVSGSLDVDRLEELFDYRPAEDTESTTVGGLVTEWSGGVPTPGDVIERDGLSFEILSASDRRVTQLRVSRKELPEEADGAAEGVS